MKQKKLSLLDDARFYLITFTVLAILLVFLSIQSLVHIGHIRLIRLQQWYAVIATIYWYILAAILLFENLAIKYKPINIVRMPKRLLAMCALYFFLLHVFFAGRLYGLPGTFSYLPGAYKWSVTLGALAALTAVLFVGLSNLPSNKHHKHAVSVLGYTSCSTVLLYMWLITSHTSSLAIQLIFLLGLLLLLVLLAITLAKKLGVKNLSTGKVGLAKLALCGLGVAILILLKFSVPAYDQAYHTNRGPVAGSNLHAH